MRWTSYCLIKHIYLEPINTSKPRPFWSKTRFFWLPNDSKCNIYILWSCSTRHKSWNIHFIWTTHDFWPFFGGEGKHHPSQKSNTPFFSRTKQRENFIFQALDRTDVPPYSNYCNLRVASPTFPSVPKAQSHNQKFSPKFLAFLA